MKKIFLFLCMCFFQAEIFSSVNEPSIDIATKVNALSSEEPKKQTSFYYFMLGGAAPAKYLLHPSPEFSFGKRTLYTRHGWDYCLGTRVASQWEELYLQASYLFHPVEKFGGYIGFGSRYGGYHVENESAHLYGFYTDFLANVGYVFVNELPGFVQVQVSTMRRIIMSYGFGF